jgi:Cys-rich protein (TIGR01571 family)
VFVAKVNGQKIRVTVVRGSQTCVCRSGRIASGEPCVLTDSLIFSRTSFVFEHQPDGGVQQGQVFDIVVVPSIKGDDGTPPSPCSERESCDRTSPAKDVDDPKSSSQQPQRSAAAAGEWKDGVGDLFKYGVLHPTVWNALCCPQVLMKQLSNRLSGSDDEASHADEMPCCGSAQTKKGCTAPTESSSTVDGAGSSVAGYKRGTTLFLVACVVDFLLIAPILEATTAVAQQDGHGGEQQSNMSFGTQCFYVLWTIALTSIAIYSVVQLRAAVRAKYGISPGRCGTCEDVCCVVCCHSCTLAQLARQTADYDEEEAHCCTVDGRSGSKRLNPCLFL